MEALVTILNLPLTQLLGLVVLAGVAQKMGFDVIGLVMRFFNQKGPTKEIDAANRNALQPLLSQMELLSDHFNHETTGALETLVRGHQEFRGTQLQQCTKLDMIVDTLQDIQRNGIRIRN